MSAASEKADQKARVTRSMRRLNSETESIDLENRPDTPTGRIRKKVEELDVGISTPKRTTRASSATRSLIDEVLASPLRRTTRRMSTDRAVESPIRATRATRRSNQNLNESEDESIIFVSEHQATPRTQKASRKTLVKLEEVLEEENDVNSKLNNSSNSNDVNSKLNASNSSIDVNSKLNTSDNDLELRNRSISKSPCVQISPNKSGKQNEEQPMSLGDELKAAGQLNGSKHKVFEFNNLNKSEDSITDELTDRSKEEIAETPADYEKQHQLETSKNEEIQEPLIDLNEEVPEIVTETTEKEAPHNASQNMEPMELDESIHESLTTTQAGDVTDSSLRVEVRMTEIHEVIEYQVSDMMSDFVADSSTSAIPPEADINNISTTLPQNEDESNESTEVAQKSPPKRKSNNWSTAVAGKSDRIDSFVAPPEEESIRAPSKSPKKSKKVISSDESDDDEYERNLLIDDEAEEVGSDEESMTKSERDYLEENEVVEDGESLGSEDSNVNELESGSDQDSNDSFIVDDEVENQYEMNTSEEEIEKEEIKQPKRKSRIIQQSSSEDEVEKSQDEVISSPEKANKKSLEKQDSVSPEKSQSISPQKSSEKGASVSPQKSSEKGASVSPEKSQSISPQKSAKKLQETLSAVADDDTLKKPKRMSLRRSLPTEGSAEEPMMKTRNSIPSSWTIEESAQELGGSLNSSPQSFNERKRKRESVIHGAQPKRFKEMSPNESEAVHMDDVEEFVDDDVEMTQVAPSAKKIKKSKEAQPADIAKLIDRCDEHLDKYNQEKRQKLAVKRKKNEEKKLKKAKTDAVKGSPGSENKENSLEKKKKKKKPMLKKQLLVSEMATEKDDMATKLTKLQDKLEQKREKKRQKKELLKATKENNSGRGDIENEVIVTKIKKTQPAEKKKILGENKQKKRQEEPPAQVVSENKSKKRQEEPPVVIAQNKTKKRRIEETFVGNDDGDIIERPKAKKKLNILQQVEDPSHNARNYDHRKPAPENDYVLPTVTSKLKNLIPKGLDKAEVKKALKKKGQGKVIAEPRISLPRPVWTSAGTFIEEPVKPFKFKTTEYKPLNANTAGSSTQFRVIPFEAKSKRTAPKNSVMELLMQRNKGGRDKTKRNMKNLI